MEPRTALLLAVLLGLPTAVLASQAPHGTLPAAAAVAAIATLFAAAGPRRARPLGLLALPMLLAAIPAADPAPGTERTSRPDGVRAGPVRCRGEVGRTTFLPARNATQLWLRAPTGPPLRLTVTGRPDVVAGDRIDAIARWTPPPAPGLWPSLTAPAETVHVAHRPRSCGRLLAAIRTGCERRLLDLVPGERGAVVATLVLGRGTRAPLAVAESHRATGLSHLLAVSGAHAAMLGVLLGLGAFGSGRRSRGRRLGARRLHVVTALAVLFTYAGITGGEPPVVRAVLMYTLAACALRNGRTLGLLVGLAAPALVTAATAPRELLGPSFLLSYAAVAGLGIAAATGPVAGADRAGFCSRLALPLRASLWATCTTAPITLAWFGQLAPWTILLTPLLAPVVGVVLVLGLLAALLASIAAPLAAPLGGILSGLTAFYVEAVALADRLPATPIRALASPHAATVTIAVLVAVVLLAWPTARSARWPRRTFGALLVALTPWFVPVATDRDARLELFAVGHGQAALVVTATGERVAIDCGSVQLPHYAARRLAVARAGTARRLDWLVITHGDHDHRNGVPALLERVRVRRAVLPARLGDSDLAARLRRHGAGLTLLAPGEGVQLTTGISAHAPAVPTDCAANDGSLWVRVRHRGRDALLCGDAQEAGITAGRQQGLATPADVLVLPHHGRDDPAVPALLDAVRPTTCLVSARAADGPTAAGGLARAHGAVTWVTGQDGDLALDLTTGVVRAARPTR